MTDKGISRRNFLKAMAAAAAATAVSSVPRIAMAQTVKQGQQQYQEAPMLADLVASGELPPIEQRIPLNPRVITPLDEVGEYGGVWRRAFKGLSDRWGPVKLNEEGAVQWDAPDPDTTNLVVNYISEWSQNDNATEYTFTLREGLKWSDGEPFTTEDVQFYYDNIYLTELMARPGPINVGNVGDVMTLEIIDDLTWKVTFTVSNPLLPIRMGSDTSGMIGGPSMAAPKHYLEKYVGTAPTADQALIDAALSANGLTTWEELWYEGGPRDGRGPINFWFRNPELPTLGAWRAINTPLDDPFMMERNPYYHAVDTEGNQLPYIDRIQHSLFEDAEILNLWIAQGLIDMQQRHVASSNFTFYKEYEGDGDYHVVTWRAATTNAFHPNISHPDPEKAALFDTPEFREALSVAINREELNELVYNGLLTPRQASPVTGSPQYNADLESRWVEYNPDRANELLDGLGYTDRDGDGYRKKPDGSTLSITLTYTDTLGNMNPDEVGIVTSYWEAIGIKVNQEVLERSLYEQRNQAGDIEVGVWYVDRSSIVMSDPRRYLGTTIDTPWCPRYATYMSSIFYGSGTTTNAYAEPPADHPVRRMHEIWHQIEQEPDEATRNALFQDILAFHVEHPYMIGTVGEDPSPIIVKNNFFNVGSGFINDDTLRNEGIARPKQFFIRS